MYGIKPFHADDAKDTESDSGAVSIEASIEKELSDLQEKKKRPQDRTFTSVNTGIECVFFLKTRKPVDPLELTRRMCADARSGDVPNGRRCKYVNRLVPVVDVDKATEAGMERVGREVLGREFALKKEGEDVNEAEKKDADGCTVSDDL
jgi:tRNA acetyltransferase TAN1